MIVLSATTDVIRVVLAGAITTSQLDCFTTWRDITTTAFTPGRTAVATNSTTNVNIVGAPAASTQRVIDTMSIYNRDTANATVTIKFYDNSADWVLWKGTLAPDEKVEYLEGVGFRVITNNGSVKSTQGNNPTASTLTTVVLGSDVINNNATPDTPADVTGLSFSVNSGSTYYFEFIIPYTTAATSTGSRWMVNGPGSPTLLHISALYATGATNHTISYGSTYDFPAAANTTSLTTGSIAIIRGFITPSSNGTVIARFASEVASSAVTAKAGAILRYQQVI